MKIRSNFVSNSSSASFILDKRYITSDDINKIKIYCKESLDFDYWELDETEDFLKGFTIMDNGYLFSWIKEKLNIPLKAIVNYDKD